MMNRSKLVPNKRFEGFAGEWKIKKYNSLLNKSDGIRRGPFGSALKKEFFVRSSNYVVYEQQNAIYDRYNTRYNITKEKYDELYRFIINEDDFIMSGAGTIGRISRVPSGVKSGVINQALIRIRVNKSIVDLEYFLQWMRSEEMQNKLTQANPASAMVNLVPMSEVKEWEISVPSIEEQQKIGQFFKHLDDMIALQQKKIDKTKALKSAYLVEMFPAEGERVPKRRFAGFTDEWEMKRLGDIVESFEYGLNASAIDYDGENKYLRITDIDEDTRLFNKNEVTSPNTDLMIAENYLLRKNDILFARTGASVGKTYRYQESDGKVYFAGFLIRGRVKNNFISEFIFQNTFTAKYDKFVKITSQRSGQPGINAKEYAEYKLMLPKKEEQNKIGLFFKKIDNTISNHQQKLEKLKATKQAYLKEMFV